MFPGDVGAVFTRRAAALEGTCRPSLNPRDILNLFGRNLNREVALIAEIGVNHEGDVEAASRMLALAAQSGADAVKFQSFTPERYVSTDDPVRIERYRKFALDERAHGRLADEAKKLGVAFFSTPVSEDWLPLLNKLGAAIKIASGDLTFEPVIRAAAAAGKPMILSTGLGTVEEIDQAVGWCRDEMGEDGVSGRLVLMHCVSAYPTPIEEANVLSVPFLAQRYRCAVGYSNHVIGWEACAAAVALGAQVIEVHFTDRKDGREFRDHALSMEAADLKLLRQTIDRVAASRGLIGKTRMPSELANVVLARKGVVAARDLPAGTTLKRDDLMFARPAREFAASEIGTLVGRRLSTAVRLGQTIPRAAIA